MGPAVALVGVAGAALAARAWWKRRVSMRGARQVTGYADGKAYPLTVVPVEEGGAEYMEVRAAEALRRLLSAGRKAGHNLTVTSGWRSNEEQQVLYRKYLDGTGNQAARPGHSNHQGGISVDLGGVLGFGTPAYAWLAANAGKYRFVNDVKGEHWHWTYKGATA
jgi:LAS superfamily LD-carboxypeptidase LdcB